VVHDYLQSGRPAKASRLMSGNGGDGVIAGRLLRRPMLPS